jgi:hypothetical protein
MSSERNGFINRGMDDELLMVTSILIQYCSLKKGALRNRLGVLSSGTIRNFEKGEFIRIKISSILQRSFRTLFKGSSSGKFGIISTLK